MNKEKNQKEEMVNASKLRTLIFMLLFITMSATMIDASLEELIASFDFDFNLNDTLVVVDQVDYMLDIDSNGVNDTLFLNFSINTSISDTYVFFVDLEDQNGIVTTRGTEVVSTGLSNVSLNINTEFLTNVAFNYSVAVYNSTNNALIFREFGLTTGEYFNYETGFKVLATADKNIGNNFIQVNATINATKAETQNVTAFLVFNDSSIKASKEVSFGVGQNIVPLEFDNETIKGTHYHGTYILETITIGEKVIFINTTTASYNFEDFAKTSYFKSYIDGEIDTDENNITDFLGINYTLDIKQTNTYLIESKIFDTFDNFVAASSKSLALSSGINTVEILFNGSEIYQSKVDGPYIIKSASLNSSGSIVDEVIEPYTLTTANLTHSQFEKPPLPDLTVELMAIFDETTSITEANLTVMNNGAADTLNIIVDLFDTGNFSWNTTIRQLNVSESQSFNLTIEESTNKTVAIVDFKNVIEEENETNNIAIGDPDIIRSFNRIASNGLTQIFEFVIQNSLQSSDEFLWNMTTGDENMINSTTLINLNEGEISFVEVAYTYSTSGNYTVTAIVSNSTITHRETITIGVTS